MAEPQFPLYIVSKGRYESRITPTNLDRMGVPYLVVIEEQEYVKYSRYIDKKKLLVLDQSFKRDYKGHYHVVKCDSSNTGSGPARNQAWEHSLSNGYKWHWVMDDNINGFYRFNKNLKVPVKDGTIFRCMEDFCLRYSNVSMAGPNYFMFAPRKTVQPPFRTNTRIYSCNLIRNDVPFRWEGKYNEDTILSINMLKAGWCTILFNAFLQFKMTTMSVKGGNTDALYKKEGTLVKSKMLERLHPDVTRVTQKWGRWHHHVDYSVFKRNKLKRNHEVEIHKGVNNYGMCLNKVSD